MGEESNNNGPVSQTAVVYQKTAKMLLVLQEMIVDIGALHYIHEFPWTLYSTVSRPGTTMIFHSPPSHLSTAYLFLRSPYFELFHMQSGKYPVCIITLLQLYLFANGQ